MGSKFGGTVHYDREGIAMEHDAGAPKVAIVRKQTEMNAGALLTFFFVLIPELNSL